MSNIRETFQMRTQSQTERLRAAFLRQYGGPLERVTGVRGPGGGVIRQLYRDQDGKLIRLRTSMERSLVTNAFGHNKTDADAALIIDGPQDYICQVMPGPRNSVDDPDIYKLPNQRTIRELQDVHRRWQPTQPNGGNSDVRAIYFDDEVDKLGHGYAVHYAQYKLQAPVGRPTADIHAMVADFRHRLAPLLKVPEEDVVVGMKTGPEGNLIAWL
jgi:hypothetical protein